MVSFGFSLFSHVQMAAFNAHGRRPVPKKILADSYRLAETKGNDQTGDKFTRLISFFFFFPTRLERASSCSLLGAPLVNRKMVFAE